VALEACSAMRLPLSGGDRRALRCASRGGSLLARLPRRATMNSGGETARSRARLDLTWSPARGAPITAQRSSRFKFCRPGPNQGLHRWPMLMYSLRVIGLGRLLVVRPGRRGEKGPSLGAQGWRRSPPVRGRRRISPQANVETPGTGFQPVQFARVARAIADSDDTWVTLLKERIGNKH
jgi:hypothetical protein